MTNHQKIIELNTIWYDLIGGTHHKDRDCHFRICTHYMYGDRVEYEVEHYGYIIDRVEQEFGTLEEAEQFLINKVLKTGILEEINFYLELPRAQTMSDYDKHPRYNKDELNKLKNKVNTIVFETDNEQKIKEYYMEMSLKEEI
jgi:hypothetical protein